MPDCKALVFAPLMCMAALILATSSARSAPSWSASGAQLKLSASLARLPLSSSNGHEGVTPLRQLLNAANEHAAAVRAANADAQAARAVEQQAWAKAWMPSLDFGASRSRLRQTYNDADLRVPASDIKLTATVPVWQASDRAIAQAQDARAAQASWLARQQRANVSHDLCLAYLHAAAAAEQRRLADAQLTLLQTQLDINDRRLQSGVGTILDQLETRTRIDQVRATSQEQRMRTTTQRLLIERLTGQAITLPAGFHPRATELPDDLPAEADALEEAPHANPQIQSTQADLLAAQAVAKARDAEFWQPTLDAQVWSEKQRQTQRFDGLSDTQNINTKSAVGVILNWPLFSGGQQHGRVREAAASLSKAEANHDDALTTVQGGLRDAYQSLTQARAMLRAQHDVEQTAQATYEAVRKAFTAGLRTNIDLLNAQQQIYAARQSQLDARLTGLTAYINILTLLDELDEAHVASLSAQFDTVTLID
jgi:outer membrane protein TolC